MLDNNEFEIELSSEDTEIHFGEIHDITLDDNGDGFTVTFTPLP